MIAQLNNASKTATFGANKFADLTPDEFRKHFLSAPINPGALKVSRVRKEPSAAPTSFSWLDHSPPVVTPVKDQVGMVLVAVWAVRASSGRYKPTCRDTTVPKFLLTFRPFVASFPLIRRCRASAAGTAQAVDWKGKGGVRFCHPLHHELTD